MHHDDSIQAATVAGQRVLVARCDESGRATSAGLPTAWAEAAASFLWLSEDATAPAASVLVGASHETVAATLVPVVDAVKRIDDSATIVETVDRSTLSGVRPPALIPAGVVEEVLDVDGGRSLLQAAVHLVGVVELSPVA